MLTFCTETRLEEVEFSFPVPLVTPSCLWYRAQWHTALF